MFEIKSKSDLRLAYWLIRECDLNKDFIDSVKRSAREFIKGRPLKWELIKGDFDGYVVKGYLPDELKSKAEAREWFDENERIEPYNSMYDCTGQEFTGWCRIFRVKDKWLCYHYIARDV